MKILVTIMLVGFMQLSASVRGQEVEVSLRLNNVNLDEFFTEIKEQTDFEFFYNHAEILKKGNLSVDVKNKSLKSLLEEILPKKGLTFVLVDDVIIISELDKSSDIKNKQKVNEIKGKVVDEKGKAIPGVTIIIKGTNVGVSSDKDGKFVIKGAKNDFLIVSFIGMKTKEVKYVGKELLITLNEDIAELSEVVVTGYQSIKKSDMAGSASTISKEDLISTGINNIEQMLQGKLPGMVVTNTSGLVGSRTKVRVRGTSTLLGSQEPVWVVDGIIQEDPLPFKASEFNSIGAINSDNMDVIKDFVGNSISWLNPNDIENITVLKDASATAIYGVKAANGVIVITTKKGEIGDLSITYSGNFSTSSKLTYDKMNLMNSQERVDVSREIYERGLLYDRSLEDVGYEGVLKRYLNKEISYDQYNSQVKALEQVNTDWFDILYRNPLSASHTISVSGGNSRTRYYGSFGLSTNKGTAIGNSANTYRGSLNISSHVNDNLQLNFRISGSLGKTKAFYTVSPYDYASKTSRVIPCMDENGNRVFYPHQGDKFMYNILNELDNTGNENKLNSLNIGLGLRYKFFKNFVFNSIFGLSSTNSIGESYATEQSYHITKKRGYEFGEYGPSDPLYRKSGLPHGGEYNYNETRNRNYTWRNTITYNKLFSETSRVSIMVGNEIRSNSYQGYSQTRYGYQRDRGMTFTNPPLQTSLENGATYLNEFYINTPIQLVDREANYFSLFATTNYTYDDRFALNFSVRTDASNKFGQNKKYKFQPVWSTGIRWNVSKEKWLKDVEFIDNLSFRASYGYQGNVVENFSPELIAQIPRSGVERRTGEYILNVKSLAYADLRWEKNQSTNYGADITIFNGRVSAVFEYYKKKTEDVINNITVPYEYGVSSMPINGGNMENSGYELSLSFVPIRTKNFSWNISLNTSKNNNKVNSTVNANENWRSAVSGSLNKEGFPVSSVWVFETDGLDNNGVPVIKIPTAEETPEARNDATVYMKYAGKLDPDFTAGLSSSLRYKTLTMGASFNLSKGGKRFLAPYYSENMTNYAPSAYDNMSKDLVNRWRKPGDEKFTNIPSLPTNNRSMFITMPNDASEYIYRLYNYTEDMFVDASFLRCNNIYLSYSIPEKLAKKLFKVKHVMLQANVSNPFIIVSDDYKGKDPEVATGSQPISKSYTLSLSVNF